LIVTSSVRQGCDDQLAQLCRSPLLGASPRSRDPEGHGGRERNGNCAGKTQTAESLFPLTFPTTERSLADCAVSMFSSEIEAWAGRSRTECTPQSWIFTQWAKLTLPMSSCLSHSSGSLISTHVCPLSATVRRKAMIASLTVRKFALPGGELRMEGSEREDGNEGSADLL